MMKLRLDGRKIAEDVCMIELQIVQDGRPRLVMDELGTLVAKGGVVLVGLDDEEGGSQSRRNAEALRHAADQKPGFSPACSRIQASSEVVVVLPWVPATPSTQWPRRTFSASHCGPDT
jgi:hypothetical protein